MLAPHYTLAVSWLGHREVTRAEVETGRDGHLVNSLEYFIYPHGKDEYDSESKFQDSNFLLKNKSLN